MLELETVRRTTAHATRSAVQASGTGFEPARRPGAIAAIVLPCLIGLVAFAFRLLSSVDLSNDHYMSLGWAQQLLLGEWPGRDFVEPGMPLVYTLSAALQHFWPGPFTELVFTTGLLAIAAGLTVLVAARLSGSWTIGVLAALFEIALQTRLYSYPKVLVPVVALLLLQRYAQRHTVTRLVLLGAWTTTALLLRHDLAAYAGGATIAGLLALHWGRRRACVTATVGYAGAALLTALPYAVYVQSTEGIAEHLRRGVEFSKAELHQRFFELPALGTLTGLSPWLWGRDEAAILLFYGMHLLPVAALVVFIARRRALAAGERATAVAACVMLIGYLLVVLRYPIDTRVPDLASVAVLVGAWILGHASRAIDTGLRTRPLPAVVAVLLTMAAIGTAGVGVWKLGKLAEDIDNTGIHGGWSDVVETYTDLRERGTTWPWARSWPSRQLPRAVLYLNACTRPDEAVLLTWPAPDMYFFARRRFAAGHVEFLPPRAFTTEHDQRQMLAWLDRQRVPIVLINDTRHDEFITSYPLVSRYLDEHFSVAGRFDIYDGSSISVGVRNDLRATGRWEPEGWPCRFQ